MLLACSALMVLTACSAASPAGQPEPSTSTPAASPSPSLDLLTWTDDYCGHLIVGGGGQEFENCVTAYIWGAQAAEHGRPVDAAMIDEGIAVNVREGNLSYHAKRKDFAEATQAGWDKVQAEIG